jgi:uncharacterized protein YkwD
LTADRETLVKVKEVKAGMPSFKHRDTSATAELDKHQHGKGPRRFSRVVPLGVLRRPLGEQEKLNESSKALQVYESRTVITPTRNDECTVRDDIEISEPSEAVPNGQDEQEGERIISQLNLTPIMSNTNNDKHSSTETEQHASTNTQSPAEETKNFVNVKKRGGMFVTFRSSHNENMKLAPSSKDNNQTMNSGNKVTRKSKLWKFTPSWPQKHSPSKEPKGDEATREEDDCPGGSSSHSSGVPSPPEDVAATSFLVIRPTTKTNMSLDQVFNVDGDDNDDEEQAEASARDCESSNLINIERNQRGLQPLRSSDYLCSLAKSHATVMAEHGMLGHSVENLVDLQLHLRSNDVGENIQSGSSIKNMHVCAMKEGTSNRMNILRESYLEYGCGSAVSEDDGKLYQVQLFRGKLVPTNNGVVSTVKEAEKSQCDYVHCCAWYLNGCA